MTTLERRKESAALRRIDAIYEALDMLHLNDLSDCSVIRFDVPGHDPKTYVALFVAGRWWATGGTAPNGVSLEDLFAWMIRKNVDPATVVKL